MNLSDPTWWFWADARRALDRVERLQRRFFEVGRAAAYPCWEPPTDVFIGDGWIFIQIALPGVEPVGAEVTIEGGTLVVSAERRLPQAARAGSISRLEIPYGRFERQVSLPSGQYEIASREMEHGCLILVLQRIRNGRPGGARP